MNGVETHKRITVVGILQWKKSWFSLQQIHKTTNWVHWPKKNGQWPGKNEETGTQTLQKCVLVLIVRGVSTNVKFLLAHFSTNGVTSDQIFCILWETIKILETGVDLDCLYITSDGASPKRRFIKLHRLKCYAISFQWC